MSLDSKSGHIPLCNEQEAVTETPTFKSRSLRWAYTWLILQSLCVCVNVCVCVCDAVVPSSPSAEPSWCMCVSPQGAWRAAWLLPCRRGCVGVVAPLCRIHTPVRVPLRPPPPPPPLLTLTPTSPLHKPKHPSLLLHP